MGIQNSAFTLDDFHHFGRFLFDGNFLLYSATLNRVFDDLFASVFQTTDAVVRSSDVVKGTFGQGDERSGLDKSLVDQVRAVDGVRRAEGNIQIFNPIVLDKAIGYFRVPGAPVLGFKWDEDEILSQWRLVSEDGGSLSAKETVKVDIKDNTVLVDNSTFESKKLKVGSTRSHHFPGRSKSV